MANNATKLIKDDLKRLMRVSAALTDSNIFVGVPSEETSREEGEMNNATLAYIHDRGAPANNIPARPFLEPGIDQVVDKIAEQMKKGAQAVMGGNQSQLDQVLNRTGLIAQNSVRKLINSGIAPELAPSTILARRRAGKTRTKPLIDTGQLRNSIIYVIRRK